MKELVMEFPEPWINNSFDMKLEEVLYKTPEVSEERLLGLIEKHHHFLKESLLRILEESYSCDKLDSDNTISKSILREWDTIQTKKSKLTRSQRDQICALVSACLIEMVKTNEES